MASSCANFAEHAQFRWQRLSKESLPRFGPKTHDAGKAPFKIPKLHCAHQRRKIRTEGPKDRAIAEARVYCRDQEDRGASKRRSDWLLLLASRVTALKKGALHPSGLFAGISAS